MEAIAKLVVEQFKQIYNTSKALKIVVPPTYLVDDSQVEFHLIAFYDEDEGYCIVDFYWDGDPEVPVLFGDLEYGYETEQDMNDEINIFCKRIEGIIYEIK